MSKDKKDSIIFYRSFYDAISKFPDKDQLILFKAVISYGLDLIEPDFTGAEYQTFVEAVWDGIRPQLSANYRRFLNGNKGGAPVGNRNNPNGRRGKKTNLELTENQPNENVKDNINANEKDSIESAKASPSAPTHKRERFVKPSLSEIEEYCMSRSNGIDASKFFDFYESKGWKVGNQPMKDWRACVRTWERKEGRQASSLPLHQPRQGTVLYPHDIYKD